MKIAIIEKEENINTSEFDKVISFIPDNDPDACIILWSVEEVVEVGSTGVEIYGSAYAASDVIVKRDSILTYIEPPTDLLLPPPPLPASYRIVGWELHYQ